jgi:adenylate cyclase
MIQTTMRNRWKKWVFWTAIVLASGVSTELLGKLRIFQLIHLKALDTHFVVRKMATRLTHAKEPPYDIVLITIDQKALDTFRELRMFWHPYYAEAIRVAGENGAKVMALDLAFAVPVDKWAPDYDRLLTEAVTTSPIPVITGYVPSLESNQEDSQWTVPLNMASSALGLSAFSNLTADSDDFVRRQELIENPVGQTNDRPLAHSFPLKIAEKFTGEEAKIENGQLYFQGHRVPVSGDRSVVINYVGPPDTFPRVSLATFLDAAHKGNKKQLHDWVAGKIVMLGTDSSAGDDRYATPFFTMFDGPRWTTAGVEIHANTVQTLLRHQYLEPMPEFEKILAIFLVASLTAAIYAAFPLSRALWWLLAEGLGILIGTHALFDQGILLSTSDLLLSMLLSLLGSATYRYATAEKRGNLFRNAVAVFVGKSVAKDLDQSEEILRTGSRQQVTILFTDIRGFTAWCEARDPAVVVTALNTYLTQMVDVIVRYDGHVNKFIGDGILAIFSDEDGSRQGNHGLRAVRCAIDMVNVKSEEFKTGAGLNSGVGIVGNIGSADKMEFTVLGGTVNLASRLESMNKENHTKLLMSETTYALLEGQIESVCLGSVPVRGQVEPVKIYTAASLVENIATAKTA